MEKNIIYNEDCLITMSRLPDDSVDLIVSSPPYDSMRKYGGDKTYHQRLKDTGYSFEFEPIAKELIRVLKPGGVIFWNVADQTIKGSRTGNSMRQSLYFMENGLNLWDHIIWYKTGTPFPSPYRYRNVWENCFVFSKGKPTVFNPILKKNKTGGDVRNHRRQRNHQGELVDVPKTIKIKEYGTDDNVWYLTNHYHKSQTLEKYDHPAVMPDELVRRAIVSYSNEGMVVYDPFLGSSTTTRIARENNRDWIGSEIHTPYFELAQKIMTNEVE